MKTSFVKRLTYGGMVAATMLASQSVLPHNHGFHKNRKAMVSEYVSRSHETDFQEIGTPSKFERLQDESLISKSEVEEDAIQYNKTAFCYDKNTYLNFYDSFQLKFEQGTVTLLPYGISFLCRNIAEFDKALVERIQTYLRKDDQKPLDDVDKKQWLALLKLFDYKQFSLDLAPALYEEFKITSLNPHGNLVFLERRDGKKYKCSIHLTPAFTNGRFKKGDLIGAWIKRDHLDNIIEINQPMLVEDEFITEEEWEQIPVI